MPKPEDGENALPPSRELAAGTLFGMHGKSCLITGGGSGIGAMIAAGFVANGADVYICSRKDSTRFSEKLTDHYPGMCTWLQCDLSKPGQIESLVERLRSLLDGGKLHCLVNNSGTNWAQPIEEYSMSGWDKTLPLIEAASCPGDPGRIINISSIDSVTVSPLDTFAYSSGKAAVSHLTRVLGGKLASRNITVNAICPGAFPSRMMRATISSVGKENMMNANPLGRLGTVYDISGVALLLASRAGAWMTGACITLDGGTVVKPRL